MSSGDSEEIYTKKPFQPRMLKSSSRTHVTKTPASKTQSLKVAKAKKKKRGEAKPGPAVASAVMRIDIWPSEKVISNTLFLRCQQVRICHCSYFNSLLYI